MVAGQRVYSPDQVVRGKASSGHARTEFQLLDSTCAIMALFPFGSSNDLCHVSALLLQTCQLLSKSGWLGTNFLILSLPADQPCNGCPDLQQQKTLPWRNGDESALLT